MRADLLDGILAFTRVAEKRSFKAAALELGVTPAAISWTIKQLESRVGTPLLNRTTRSVGLTDAGALFLEHARQGVSQVMTGFVAAQSFGMRPAGVLRLNVPLVAQPQIEPLLAGFADAYPDIELELAMEDRFIDIVAEGFDAGIRIGETIAQDMIAVRFMKSCPMVVVGSSDYFRKRGKPKRPEDLSEHSCVNIRQTSGRVYRWAFEEKASDGGARVFDIAVKGPLTVNTADLTLSAAASGVGLTYNIAANVAPLVEQGILETCLEDFMPVMPGFFIYFPAQSKSLPKLRAFLDFCADYNLG
ncbi:LysR substrate-binding domain-containing protein [Rhizobium sp. NXC24]|uniref:LysR substrate-binding domain-containing protein n=1 Tax=Rhizobium sp. NXC24 TaxID=2048897 RepID=UPI000CF1F3A0|nr:LysR substrate-binding domain-containing protein [Rhizobium sp. NXC24]